MRGCQRRHFGQREIRFIRFERASQSDLSPQIQLHQRICALSNSASRFRHKQSPFYFAIFSLSATVHLITIIDVQIGAQRSSWLEGRLPIFIAREYAELICQVLRISTPQAPWVLLTYECRSNCVIGKYMIHFCYIELQDYSPDFLIEPTLIVCPTCG